MDEDKTFYSLCNDEIQVVARDVWEVELCKEDLVFLQDKISDAIPWYEIIEGVIMTYQEELKTKLPDEKDYDEEE